MFHTTNKKQLILVRHAQAIDASEFTGSDFDRPLTAHWRKHNTVIARYLRLIWIRPDTIISSSAIRTRETAGIISTEFNIDGVELVDGLYFGNNPKKRNGNQSYLKAIQSVSKDTEILMLVGHNDEITEFAQYLTGEGMPSMKKGSIAVFSLPNKTKWKEIGQGELTLLYYLTPQFLQLESLI